MEIPVSSFAPVTVTLQADQWPVVLKSMEIAADYYKRHARTVAEAVILESRMEIARQIKLSGKEPVRA